MALRIEARVSASWLRASPAGKMVERAADWLRRRWVVDLSRPRGSSAEEESEIGGLDCGLKPVGGRGGLDELAGRAPLLGRGGPAPLLRLSWLSMGSLDVRDFDAARSLRGLLLFKSDGPSLGRPRPRDDDGAAIVSPASKPLLSRGGPGPMAEEALGISIQGLKCGPKDACVNRQETGVSFSFRILSAGGCASVPVLGDEGRFP